MSTQHNTSVNFHCHLPKKSKSEWIWSGKGWMICTKKRVNQKIHMQDNDILKLNVKIKKKSKQNIFKN